MDTPVIRNSRARKILGCIALLLIALGAIALVHSPTGKGAGSSSATSTAPVHINPPSAAVLKQLAASKGFSALVSFAGARFNGATTTIEAGQTIRFTNNSSDQLWIGEITAADTPENPNTQSCDVSFNSCHPLAPDDFFEFTFPTAGTFYYMDNLDPSIRGAVVVN